jgi:hypothetical protein
MVLFDIDMLTLNRLKKKIDDSSQGWFYGGIY